jgi:hypothetical protein
MKRQLTRSTLAATAIAATVALAAPASAGAFEPRVPETFFGVSHPNLWHLNVSGQQGTRNAQLVAIKAEGLDWVRTEIGWPEVEPNAPTSGSHSYRWQAVDRQFEAFAARGLELYPILTPPRSRPGA